MSFYQTIVKKGSKYIGKDRLLKYGFNLSPMYRRSTARVKKVSKDLKYVQIKLPISYKNRNYMNTIFGGSMFSAVDPIPMVQLINIINDPNFVIWDKSAEINFKRPAGENLYAEFIYTDEEITDIKKRVAENNEIEIIKTTQLTNQDKTKVYCEVHKKIYVADKGYFTEKRKKRKASNQNGND